jgi:hypothetical protein
MDTAYAVMATGWNTTDSQPVGVVKVGNDE